MPLLAALSLAIQLFFIVHAYRSGAPRYWIFVIFAFPVAGCLAYYFFEVFPKSREARSARKAVRGIVKALDPDRDLRARVEEVRTCGSVDNRMALAEECIVSGLYGDAIRLYESCREGPYANDPQILYGLARAAVEDGRHADAEAALTLLAGAHPKFKAQEVGLLKARTLEGRAEHDAALAAYRALLPAYVGFEAQCRYGLLLHRLGHADHAQAAFREVLDKAKRQGVLIDSELHWVGIARRQQAPA